MAALEFRNLVKRYGGETVLDSVSFGVGDGEALVLFGPSGAGKTVLLRLIAGVIDPEEGEILIDGHDVSGVDPENRGVGMAFQNFALFPHMTAFENIATPLRAHGRPDADLRAGVEKIAQLLKIGHVLTHAPGALSNGEKQRTALARALAGSPPILLLDDPLRNVDAKLRFEMRLELPRLLAGRRATVIYVTQDYKEAMALGDRIAVMSQGKIAQLGAPEDLYLRPANIEVARLFGDPAINLLEVRPSIRDGEAFAEISGVKIPLGTGGRISGSRPCILGLRPESLRFAAPATAGAIPVTIEAETPLNEKTVTLARTAGGREILISRPAGAQGVSAGQAFVAPGRRPVLIFDGDSGANISPEAGLRAGEGRAA